MNWVSVNSIVIALMNYLCGVSWSGKRTIPVSNSGLFGCNPHNICSTLVVNLYVSGCDGGHDVILIRRRCWSGKDAIKVVIGRWCGVFNVFVQLVLRSRESRGLSGPKDSLFYCTVVAVVLHYRFLVCLTSELSGW